MLAIWALGAHIYNSTIYNMKQQLPKYSEYFERGFPQTVRSANSFCFQTMSSKEKSKFEDLAKQDKARYEREMMSYVPARGGKKKKFKDPNAPKRPP